MYIYQIERDLLRRQMSAAVRHLRGRTLNIGSGSFERYDLPDTVTEYIRMDIVPGRNVDIVGRAEAIPFPNESFDAVISTQVFEHIENPEQAAKEVNRVLKHDGHVLITVPQWNELHEEPHDYWRYTKYGLETLFSRHGCTLESIEQRGGYFAVRAQMRIRYYLDRYDLYSHPLRGRIASRIFSLCGKWALWRDRRDPSAANRKHALGWCAVFRKQ